MADAIAIPDEQRARGATVLHVIGNPHAQGFYLACGFTLTGTVDMPNDSAWSSISRSTTTP